MNYSKSLIPVIDVYITGQCNFKCQYCFGENDKNDAITLELYTKILEFANSIGAKVGLTGGEPLMHPNFEEIVLSSKKKQVPLILRTNGMLLNKYIYLCDSFEWIGVSLDGTENINNIMRPTAKGFVYTASDKIEIPLKSIRDIKDKFPSIKILIATVATSKNIKYLLDLAELLRNKSIPVNLWKIYQFTSNNFRSLLTKNKFKTSDESLYDLENSIREKVDFDVIFKYGEGNCLLIDINGNFMINGIIIGNINDDFLILAEKIRNSTSFNFLVSNKQSTYGIN